MRVLLVEDSRRLRTYIKDGLTHAGYAVDVAPDGEEGLWLARSGEYDVIVLDLMLPKLDGLGVLRRIREDRIDTHVLILTARDSIHDRVLGLEEGADDYLVKPFALEEFFARVKTLARRSYGRKSPHITIGPLVIDTAKRSVSRDGERIDLTPREFSLLEYLALREGEVVSRTEIEGKIFDDLAEPMSNVIDSSVYRLRKKIDREGSGSLLKTRRGMGYVLEDPGQ